MARQIKPTPILTGDEARRFERTTKENERRKISEASYQRSLEAVKTIKFARR